MTAFAGAERDIRGRFFSWEVRSVNHRYLDVSVRLPEAFRFLEPEIRTRIGAWVKRGRVDCTLSCKKSDPGAAPIQVNRALVAELVAAARQVEELAGGRLAGFHAFDVLQWPGVLQEPELGRDELAEAALEVLAEALKNLVAMRETEGRQLARLIQERCDKLQEHVAAIRRRFPEALTAIRQRILTRLAELVANPDTDRLEQEMVYQAQKLDIAEELDRLDTHAEEVVRTLREEEPIGRRLDFLLQEMNREANTLASKSADAETTRCAVEIKVLVEQMREQIQNIE